MKPGLEWEQVLASPMEPLLRQAWDLSREVHGNTLSCFIPGRMHYMGDRGRYPTISITGAACALNCDHCQRHILRTMLPATTPDLLVETCQRADAQGDLGVLISGGSRRDGTLAWDEGFIDAIREVREATDLHLTIHTGLIDVAIAQALADAGVEEFLIDVIGSAETLSRVYHLEATLDEMESSLTALEATGRPVIPHIVVGLDYGRILGEPEALEMVARHPPYALVIVVLRPVPGSPMDGVEPPATKTVARFIAMSRLRLPEVPIALSCARPPGRYRKDLDPMAVDAGINRIAMPAEEALTRARELGLEVEFYHTCCSKSY